MESFCDEVRKKIHYSEYVVEFIRTRRNILVSQALSRKVHNGISGRLRYPALGESTSGVLL
jgi:hypothetical protein